MKRLFHRHHSAIYAEQIASKAADTLTIFRNRWRFSMAIISMLFVILAGRIIELNIMGREVINNHKASKYDAFVLKRKNILDRNGVLLATNVHTASFFINAQEVIEPAIAARKVQQVLPELSLEELQYKFRSGKSFVWIKRHITPDEQQKIHDLGLPGLYFMQDEKRVYPQSNLFAHAVGFVNIDGVGISGLERQFDESLNSVINGQDALQLSLDLRLQSVVHEALQSAVDNHSALGGAALLMDVNNGEILAMVSLPDFNPNQPQNANEQQLFNQTTLGVYEMGSTMKLLTAATGFDTAAINVNDVFDVSTPIKLAANHVLNDFKPINGALTVPEVLLYSSNRGTVQIAAKFGEKVQRTYMHNFGMLSKVGLELPEVSSPIYPSPKQWNETRRSIVSFGYGLSVTLLHVAKAVGAVVNGGILYEPTLLKNAKPKTSKRVLSQETSAIMRSILHLIVEHGSGKRAKVAGYAVGGKTGTGEVLRHGKYDRKANRASFVGAFPIHQPKYLLVVLIDQAKPSSANGWRTTGGMIAAPVAGEIVRKVGMLSQMPTLQKEEQEAVQQQLSLNFTPLYKSLSPAN